MKNKSYIGISLIILVFGTWSVFNIDKYVSEDRVVNSNRSNTANSYKANLKILGKAPEINLTDHNNQLFNNHNLKGKVYVVEFFFTTCPTICPKMNENMLQIEKEFIDETNFSLISITINPAYDNSEVLKQYANKIGVKHENWYFLTGEKQYIYNIANKGFKLYAGENQQAQGGFEHSGYFALIDQKGRIRCRIENGNSIGFYDGLDQKNIQWLITDIKKLLKEN